MSAASQNRSARYVVASGLPACLAALRERAIVLEICPTSNLLTNQQPSEQAPDEKS